MFVFFASAIWALLPAVATSDLHLGSGAYGLLLGCVGVGAVGGALLLPRLRARLSPDGVLAGGAVAVGLTALAMGTVHSTAVVAISLALGGLGWILSLATFNIAFQTTLPGWAKARGIAVYLIAFQGGNAIGSAVFGVAAGGLGLNATMIVVAVGLVIGPLLSLRRRMPRITAAELGPSSDWPMPDLSTFTAQAQGPVMVTLEFRSAPGHAEDMLRALAQMRRARRRTGAVSWRAWRDVDDTDLVLEQFVVGSWDEHERQHSRFTARDRERMGLVESFVKPGTEPTVRHWSSVPTDAGIAPAPETIARPSPRRARDARSPFH